MTEPKKYRKKPVVIEAMRFSPDANENHDLDVWLGKTAWFDKENRQYMIYTLEGTITASVGDYIIKGVQGEFYPCKPDIFEQTYEAEDD